ncbi:T9SS type A sorting domain-containing protein [candidate division KSB1 bacterium]|nr:T9SS type A sorting domain-containing protein [candidate division KSB1 bacterium]
MTFRYYPSQSNVVRAFVPGTFNNWGPNASGVIQPTAPSLMTYLNAAGYYVKKIRFATGTTHYYKFHEHYNAAGTDWKWFTDPINPLVNFADNNNSILKVTPVMIFQISPKPESIVLDSQINVMAGVFSAENDPILLDQSTIAVDGQVVSTLSGYVQPDWSLLTYPLSGLKSGSHQVVIKLITKSGRTTRDSTQFLAAVGEIVLLTPSCDRVLAKSKTIRWRINLASGAVQKVSLKQLRTYTFDLPPQSKNEYASLVNLQNGENQYVVSVTDTANQIFESDTLKLTYPVPQVPAPRISFKRGGKRLQITGEANDPQQAPVTFSWTVPPTNATLLPGVTQQTAASFVIDLPTTPGDYAIKLTVTDPDGYLNATTNFFTIRPDSSMVMPDSKTVPNWVAQARIYCMFIKSYTAAGTINAAMANLEHIKNMGFNVIWVLPVMDVEGVVDQGVNVGYNIIDFYNVEPAYGTNADFKALVAQAHAIGLRVILDVTPNHSGRYHPLAIDVKQKQKFSRYYDFYQHAVISHNDNGLGQSLTPEGIVYYSGFSDALLNWNWVDPEARQYMLDMYVHWIQEYDLDGYRFDVYWGPHRRYGLENFDKPLRAALRAAKADLMLLGETDGTGAGTEIFYGDTGGGIDLGYDWQLKGTILNYPGIRDLDTKLYNTGYRPGPNSFFLRFLENQDEDRVAFRYNSIGKTIPVSTALFTATGIPLIFQGQEVGMGFGMSGNKEYRLRSCVNWLNPPATILAPHYQKLAQIRAQFPAFATQMEDLNLDGNINRNDPNPQPRLWTSDNNRFYALGRPFTNQNGLAVMNFGSDAQTVKVSLQLTNWAKFEPPLQPEQTYYLNNLYQNTSQVYRGSELDTLSLWLAGYGVAVFTISTQSEQVHLPQLTVNVPTVAEVAPPWTFQLRQNYPNPFNPTTTIEYEIATFTDVLLEIYNVLGQKIQTLVNQRQNPGQYRIRWDGLDFAGVQVTSGLYFYRLHAGEQVVINKMLFLK